MCLNSQTEDKETEWRQVTAAHEVMSQAVPQAINDQQLARSVKGQSRVGKRVALVYVEQLPVIFLHHLFVISSNFDNTNLNSRVFVFRNTISVLRESLKGAKENKATRNNRIISATEKTLNKLDYELKDAEAKVRLHMKIIEQTAYSV